MSKNRDIPSEPSAAGREGRSGVAERASPAARGRANDTEHAARWYCCRQRAGPLVKECRALRPRLSGDDLPSERSGKRESQKHIRTAVNRSDKDRIELRLAAIGWDATHYVLTFDNEHLPKNYSGVQAAQRSFIKTVRRWRQKCGKPPDFDWLAVIEGKHGDHRWHIHFIADYDELSPAEVCVLWRFGFPTEDDESYIGAPVLLDQKGFRRLAEYLDKEARPVGKRKYTCSRSLDRKIGEPARWEADSGSIRPGKRAVCVSYIRGTEPEQWDNGWGKYRKLSWLVPDGSPDCLRALRRMGLEVAKTPRAHARADARDITCKGSGNFETS